MKIASWNINSIRIRLESLAYLAALHNPDIIMLQETKVNDLLFPYASLKAMGYQHMICSGENSYNGVAIISKIEPQNPMILSFYNEQRRHLSAVYDGIEIHNFYVPAGGEVPDINLNPKFAHKLAYLDEMHEWFRANRSNDMKMVLAGDLNIAPFEHDVWSSKQLRNVISHTDIERELMLRNINEFGWVDSFRHFIPLTEKLYTWWSYRNLDWQESNHGRRLDHIWVTPSLSEALTQSYIFKDTRTWERPSDHVPIFINLK